MTYELSNEECVRILTKRLAKLETALQRNTHVSVQTAYRHCHFDLACAMEDLAIERKGNVN